MNRLHTHIRKGLAKYYGWCLGTFTAVAVGFLWGVYGSSAYGSLPPGSYLARILSNAHMLSLILLPLIGSLTVGYLLFFSFNSQMRKRAATYYAWFWGMCILVIGGFLWGGCLYGPVPQGFPETVQNGHLLTLILLSVIGLVVVVYRLFLAGVSDNPRSVEITDADIEVSPKNWTMN